ncbi:MAG: glycosyltransferase family 2 protein [Rhodoferax sp.]
MNKPAISFVMAACKRPGFAMIALDSLKRQTTQDWELIVSPDDGDDYSDLAQSDSRVKVVPSRVIQTGPARARNRALALASGMLVAVLDDDDCLEPAFVAQAVSHFKSSKVTFATAPTKYFFGPTGSIVRRIGQFATMGIDRFGREFGTMHAIGRREIYPQWKPGFAEDVMHTCKCIDLAGGEIAVLPDANYMLRLHPDSLCAVAHCEDVSRSYKELLTRPPYEMSSAGAVQTRTLLLRRIEMNEAFSRHGGGLQYHQFVNTQGHAGPVTFMDSKRHGRVFLASVRE